METEPCAGSQVAVRLQCRVALPRSCRVPFRAGPDGAQRATDGGIDRRIRYGEKENNHKTAMKKMCMLALAAMVSALPVMAKGGEQAETEAQKA